MKNKEELLETIEAITEDEDISEYIFITKKGILAYASKADILVLVTNLLHYLKFEEKTLNDNDIDNVCKLAKKDNNNLMKELLEKMKDVLEKMEEE